MEPIFNQLFRFISLSLLLIIFVGRKSHAEVYPANGSFIKTIVLPTDKNTSQAIQLRLVYDHQNGDVGYFGQGWCSLLDVNLSQIKDHIFNFKNCAATINFIEDARGTFQIQDSKAAQKLSALYLVRQGKNFKVMTQDGSTYLFDKKYTLLEAVRGTQRIQFEWQQDRVLVSVANSGLKILFKLNKHNLVEKLSAVKSVHAFEYTRSNLIKIITLNGLEILKASHDENGRIISFKQDKTEQLTIKYDLDLNIVSEISNGRCSEFLSYNIQSESRFHLKTKRFCKGAVDEIDDYDFTLSSTELISEKQNSTGNREFRQVETADGKHLITREFGDGRIQFFDKQNRIKSIHVRNNLQTYEYNLLGQLQKTELWNPKGVDTSEIRYNKFGKIILISSNQNKTSIDWARNGLPKFIGETGISAELKNGKLSFYKKLKPMNIDSKLDWRDANAISVIQRSAKLLIETKVANEAM